MLIENNNSVIYNKMYLVLLFHIYANESDVGSDLYFRNRFGRKR